MAPFPLEIANSSSANLYSIQKPAFTSSLPPATISYNRRKSTENRSHVMHQVLKSVLRSQVIENESKLSDSVDEFWEWAIKRGAVVPSHIKPGINATEGIGLVTQKDISKREVVLEVPKSLWINPDTVAASEIGKLCQDLKPWTSIALFLIREKALGSSSMWFHYLSILPSSTNSPIFWSEEELLEIQGTQLLSTSESVKEYVRSEFIKIEEEIILPNRHLFPSVVTVADFLWAFGMLRSRAFSGLRGENLVLIPLADLVNHSPGIRTEESSWEIKAKGLFSRELLFSLWTPIYLRSGEQDEKLIEEGNIGPRAKIAIGIRLSEKKVLEHIDGVFRARELELDELEYYQERRLKDLGLVGEQGDIIF